MNTSLAIAFITVVDENSIFQKTYQKLILKTEANANSQNIYSGRHLAHTHTHTHTIGMHIFVKESRQHQRQRTGAEGASERKRRQVKRIALGKGEREREDRAQTGI